VQRWQRNHEIAERPAANDGHVVDGCPVRYAGVVLDCLEESFLQSRLAGL
jgi:hypothetical protein